MLRSVNLLKGLPIQATDGDAGTVDAFLFDEERWVIRYLVLNTHEGLGGKRVLISPVAIESPDAADREFRIAVSRKQLEECPDFNLEEPITRGQERLYHGYFAWPLYWGGGYRSFWGNSAFPGMRQMAPMDPDATPDIGVGSGSSDEEDQVSYLHTTDNYLGYTVLAQDGTEVGEVDDFLVDDRTWALAYVAVYCGGWLGGRRILVPVESFKLGSWAGNRANVQLPPETLRTAPEWQPLETMTGEYEARLHAHYGVPRYAVGERDELEEPDEGVETEEGSRTIVIRA